MFSIGLLSTGHLLKAQYFGRCQRSKDMALDFKEHLIYLEGEDLAPENNEQIQ